MTATALQSTRGVKPPRVLVVTYALDPTADYVLHELNARGVPFWRTDLSDFPLRTILTARLGPDSNAWTGGWRGTERGIDLSELRTVWWRKPTPFEFAGSMSGPERAFAAAQAKQAITVLNSLPRVLWVNAPQHNADCTKAVQLAAAVRSGLRVPETLITNEPDEVARFAKECGGRVVTKALGGIVHTEGGKRGQLYTRRVPSGQWDDPRIALTAHLFQREITDRAYEVRVTVVDLAVFAAAIHAPAGRSAVDWRPDASTFTYERVSLPGGMKNSIRTLVRRLALRFAALDFIVDSQGTYFLVDVNPGGQWAWIPPTRDVITQALADLLEKGYAA